MNEYNVVSVPFKVIVPNTSQLTCHSFTGDLYIPALAYWNGWKWDVHMDADIASQGE